MENEYHRPSFLHPEVAPTQFPEKEYREGSYTRVAKLKEMPGSVRELARGDFVVKEYRFHEGDPGWRKLFQGDKPLMGAAEWRLTAIARRLKERHDRVAHFFEGMLPDLVVPTQFIVGAREGGGPESKRLYEIQSEVEPAVVISDEDISQFGDYMWGGRDLDEKRWEAFTDAEVETLLHETSDRHAAAIRAAVKDPARLRAITSQIEVVLRRAEHLVEETKWIPYDIFKPDNLIVTVDGLRIVDTNMGVHPARDVYATRRQFDRGVKFWEEVARRLAAAEEEPVEIRRAA